MSPAQATLLTLTPLRFWIRHQMSELENALKLAIEIGEHYHPTIRQL